MQRRAVVVSAAAAVLGLSAAVLGFAAEYFKHKAFVGSDAFRCEYRRTPALGCGIAAALLSLTAAALVTAASRCFGRFDAAAPAATQGGRACVRTVLAALAWLMVLAATTMFLYGAARNAGGTGGFTAVRRWPGLDSDGRTFDFVCPELRDGIFVAASIKAAIGIACAITAYVDLLQQRDRTATLGVAMGQPQWSQPPYPAPVAYPAQPPYGGYGAKQPAGTA